MIQDHDELLKEYIEIIEMTDDTKPDLNKPYLKYGLSFICILFITYKGQNCRIFRFGYIDINMVVIDDLLPNFVGNDEYTDTIFLLGDKIFVVDETFLQYMEKGGEFLV